MSTPVPTQNKTGITSTQVSTQSAKYQSQFLKKNFNCFNSHSQGILVFKKSGLCAVHSDLS